MIYVSCDPGINGALVGFEDDQVIKIFDMPTILPKGSKKNVVDLVKVREILEGVDIMVIERVGASPRMGVSSAFNFGASYMGVIGVAIGIGVSVVSVTPVKWKTFQGLIKQPKAIALDKALELYPTLKNELRLQKHVDRADAILIGDYAYRRLLR